MATTPVSRSDTSDNPHAGTQTPKRCELRRHPNLERDEPDDRKNFLRDAYTPNKSFFFAPNQAHHSRVRILKNTALKTSTCTESMKVVKLTKRGLGFHKSQDLITLNLNRTSF